MTGGREGKLRIRFPKREVQASILPGIRFAKWGEAPGQSPGLPTYSRFSDRVCYLKDFTAVASSSFTSKTV